MEEKEKKKDDIKFFKCETGCCKYSIIPYRQYYYSNNIHSIQSKIKKAGSFIYNPKTSKILLVQSRGQLWGPPKGTLKCDESIVNCAIREVKEETGIDITESQFQGDMLVNSKARYYFTELDLDEKDDNFLLPQVNSLDKEANDANGIGWFNVNCLNKLISDGKIFINQHCRILIKKIFDKEILYNNF